MDIILMNISMTKNRETDRKLLHAKINNTVAIIGGNSFGNIGDNACATDREECVFVFTYIKFGR